MPPPIPSIPYPEVPADWAAINARPEIDPSAWVAPGAVVMGRVKLKACSSIWFGCVLRGDEEFIEVGSETNVQDGSVLHVDKGYPCVLGNRVTVGHLAIVHGSIVKDGALIAIGAKVLSRCEVGEGALVAAGALVKEGTKIPPNTLWAGVPAVQVKELNADQQKRLAETYKHYVNNGQLFIARYGRKHIEALGL